MAKKVQQQLSSLFQKENFHPVRAEMEEAHHRKAMERTRERMGELFHDNQVLGRRSTIGCVALEITQRCNLDCTLCYLSEHSEAVRDIPLEEIYRRVDEIKNHFAAGTDIQITGGDPTLRDKDELISIIKYIRDVGMRPTLMTNGILASREYVSDLVEAGLNDIAIHVDITQERKGYKSETDLNEVREEYIERLRGIKVAVIFNTTVCEENFHEVPDIVRFFRKHADVVGMASFQLQADTGRGVLRKREEIISLETVRKKIVEGAEVDISWDTILIGHPACHRIGITLEANGNLYDLNDDPKFFSDFNKDFAHLMLDRRNPPKVVRQIIWELLKQPTWIFRAAAFFTRHIWNMRSDVLKSGGKIHKLSFFVQNFMDADGLDEERVHACSFMVMTGDGPVSMCAHNAKRDDYILKPIELTENGARLVWDPLTGEKKRTPESPTTWDNPQPPDKSIQAR